MSDLRNPLSPSRLGPRRRYCRAKSGIDVTDSIAAVCFACASFTGRSNPRSISAASISACVGSICIWRKRDIWARSCRCNSM